MKFRFWGGGGGPGHVNRTYVSWMCIYCGYAGIFSVSPHTCIAHAKSQVFQDPLHSNCSCNSLNGMISWCWYDSIGWEGSAVLLSLQLCARFLRIDVRCPELCMLGAGRVSSPCAKSHLQVDKHSRLRDAQSDAPLSFGTVMQ